MYYHCHHYIYSISKKWSGWCNRTETRRWRFTHRLNYIWSFSRSSSVKYCRLTSTHRGPSVCVENHTFNLHIRSLSPLQLPPSLFLWMMGRKRRSMTSPFLFLFIYVSFFLVRRGQDYFQLCGDAHNYIANSTFECNLQRLLCSSLVPNANNANYLDATEGSNTDKVYELV